MPLPDSTTYPKPPGQERAYPQPTKTGKVPFQVPNSDNIQAETFYMLYGSLDSDKVPLIILNGGPGATYHYMLTYSLIYADLDVPVLFYDQIGCGQSTHFRDRLGDNAFWTVELFMAELDNLKRALGIKTYDLLGQSWGGMLAVDYICASRSTGLRKLILSDAPASIKTWVKVVDELRGELPLEVLDVLNRCEKEGRTDAPEYEEAAMKFYKRHICRLDPFPEELQESFKHLAEDNTSYLTMFGPNEFLVTGSLKNWDKVDELTKLTKDAVPGGILLMNGYFDEAQDEVTMPFFKRASANVKWVRFGLSSHMIQLEETEKVIKTVEIFLQD